MRSVRNASYFPGYPSSARAWRKFVLAERRQAVTLEDFLANLERTPATPAAPHHMFGAMIMLLGLQLMGPALLTSTGSFNDVLAMFPPVLPHVFAVMALVGGLTVIFGIALFLDGLRRAAAR